jgi:hypothetical protein
MNDYPLEDELLSAVREARPAITEETLSPASPEAQAILDRLQGARRRRLVPAAGSRRRHRTSPATASSAPCDDYPLERQRLEMSVTERRPRRRRMPTIGGVFATLSALAAVVVAIVALTVIKHHQPAVPTRTTDAVETNIPSAAKLPLGTPAGPGTANPKTFQGAAIPSTVTLVAETPDPHGGLPWGLRQFQTTRQMTCLQVGRVQDGTIGVIGQDGAWQDDHRFHPISPNAYIADSCSATDAHGAAFNNVSVLGAIASADVPWGTGRQSGECRTGAEPHQFPLCPPADLRKLDYGLLGPEAISITYVGTNGRLYTETTNGPNGAYLIVRASSSTLSCSQTSGGGQSCTSGSGRFSGPSLQSGVITSVTYRNGHVCNLPAPTSAGAAQASCPPIHTSTSEIPQTHVRVRVTRADQYCAPRRGQTVKRCPQQTQGLVRLGGPSNQWLVIFSFTAPTSTEAHGRTYYYFTADAPGRCPNASQFGEYNEAVRRGQRVTLWAAFDKRCPGRGHGTISLITPTTAHPVPGEGSSRPVATFNFAIP